MNSCNKINLNFTGERVVPGKMQNNINTLVHHIARYNFALNYVSNKVVLDAACGTGYGTQLLSYAAANVVGVDIDPATVNYANETFGPAFSVKNLDDYTSLNTIDIKPDVVVSFETIEHLTDPDIFIGWIKNIGAQLIFSVPLNMPSIFHKHVFKNAEDILALFRKHSFKQILLYSQEHINFYSVGPTATYIVGVVTI